MSCFPVLPTYNAMGSFYSWLGITQAQKQLIPRLEFVILTRELFFSKHMVYQKKYGWWSNVCLNLGDCFLIKGRK